MTPPRKRVRRTCQYCGAEFEAWPSTVKAGHAKFCSFDCKGLGSRRVNNIRVVGEMAYVELVNRKGGLVAETLIDLEDVSRLRELGLCWKAQWDKTTRDYYVTAQTRGENKRGLVLHRWLMDVPPHLQVDHINHDRLDNRRSVNLRICTSSQNLQNRKGAVRGSASGVRNVTWCKSSERWMVRIMVNGKSIYLGMYDDLKEAEAVAVKGRRRYMTHSRD